MAVVTSISFSSVDRSSDLRVFGGRGIGDRQTKDHSADEIRLASRFSGGLGCYALDHSVGATSGRRRGRHGMGHPVRPASNWHAAVAKRPDLAGTPIEVQLPRGLCRLPAPKLTRYTSLPCGARQREG